MDDQNLSVTLSRSRSIIPITLALVAWGAVAFNYVDRHYLSVPQTSKLHTGIWGNYMVDKAHCLQLDNGRQAGT